MRTVTLKNGGVFKIKTVIAIKTTTFSFNLQLALLLLH